MTFSPDGARLYVANLGANHISVINVATATLVDEIAVAGISVSGGLVPDGPLPGRFTPCRRMPFADGGMSVLE